MRLFRYHREQGHDFTHGFLVSRNRGVQRFVPSKSIYQLREPQCHHVVAAHKQLTTFTDLYGCGLGRLRFPLSLFSKIICGREYRKC